MTPTNGHSAELDDSFDKETMYVLGGAALVLFGAGMLISSRTVRRFLGQKNLGSLVSAAVPDIEKYMKLRQM
jgi:hypothetical protein